MSLRALLEIVVHLESFRNVDLFYQGLYYVKIKVSNANPYCVFTSKIQQEKQKKMKNHDHHNLIPSQIQDDTSTFCSRAFLIRYCEEEVEINDIGLFRAEIDVEPEYLNSNFFIDFELFFSDLHILGGPEKWQSYVNEFETKAVFKSVSKAKSKINRLAQGLSEFVPVVFEDQYYSVLNCHVLSILLDYRFRVRSLKTIQSDIAAFQEKGVVQKSQEQKKKQDQSQTRKQPRDENEVLLTQVPDQQSSLWKFKPQNIAEFFFADENGELPREIDLKEVDLLHNDYIRVMNFMHEKLRQTYNQYVTKFMDEKSRKEWGIEFETQKLILPGEDEDISKMFESNLKDQEEEIKEEENKNQGGKSQGQKNDDEANESQYNIDETNESFSERKNHTNIPSLRNNKNVLNKHQIPLSERILKGTVKVDVNDPHGIANHMIFEINLLAGKMLILQHKLIEVLKITPRFITEFHHFEYNEKMRMKWGENVFRNVVPTSDFSIPSDENIGETHKKLAKNKRANFLFQGAEQLKVNLSSKVYLQIEDLNLFSESSIHPIIFEECYVKDGDPKFVNLVKNSADLTEQKLLNSDGSSFDPSQNYMQNLPSQFKYSGVHLFILVHGFQGNSCDMRLLKNNLSIMHPDAIFLSSNANEEQTEGDILEMGERLANEVKQYIQSFCPVSCLARMSFIGHSLGGLIIRAALPHLEEFKDKFYTYMSLSSPHLGYMYNSNKLFDAGMWVLKKWRKSKCLTQLSMSDNKNLEETVLYKLSCMPGINWFKNIALVSSYQDQYAPFDSARIQICKKASDDYRGGKIYIKMAQNLLKDTSSQLLYRLDVNFKINDKQDQTYNFLETQIHLLEGQPIYNSQSANR